MNDSGEIQERERERTWVVSPSFLGPNDHQSIHPLSLLRSRRWEEADVISFHQGFQYLSSRLFENTPIELVEIFNGQIAAKD